MFSRSFSITMNFFIENWKLPNQRLGDHCLTQTKSNREFFLTEPPGEPNHDNFNISNETIKPLTYRTLFGHNLKWTDVNWVDMIMTMSTGKE